MMIMMMVMMMMMMMTVIIVIMKIIMMMIVMITLTGANRDFLQSPHSAANRLQHISSGRNGVQITCKTSGAYHVQHAVYHVVRRTAQLMNLTKLKLHLFQLCFTG